MDVNGRMNSGNLQNYNGRNTKGQNKRNNRNQEGFEPMTIQNQMFNNMYNNQINNAFVFPQQNPMINMNYSNPMMQMNLGFQRNNMIPGGMNNYESYQNNLNNINKMNNKKNKKGDNYIKKDKNEYKNIEEVIENAIILSKDHSGSRLVQKKYEEGDEEVRTKIFEKLKPEILNLSKDILETMRFKRF